MNTVVHKTSKADVVPRLRHTYPVAKESEATLYDLVRL